MTKPHQKPTPAARPADTSLVGINLYQGPLPSSGEFAGYEQAHAGAADRILTMAETEQKARIHERQLEQRADFIIDLMSQVFLYGLVISAVYLAMNDKPLEALFAGIGPVVITIYANIRHKSAPES